MIIVWVRPRLTSVCSSKSDVLANDEACLDDASITLLLHNCSIPMLLYCLTTKLCIIEHCVLLIPHLEFILNSVSGGSVVETISEFRFVGRQIQLSLSVSETLERGRYQIHFHLHS